MPINTPRCRRARMGALRKARKSCPVSSTSPLIGTEPVRIRIRAPSESPLNALGRSFTAWHLPSLTPGKTLENVPSECTQKDHTSRGNPRLVLVTWMQEHQRIRKPMIRKRTKSTRGYIGSDEDRGSTSFEFTKHPVTFTSLPRKK